MNLKQICSTRERLIPFTLRGCQREFLGVAGEKKKKRLARKAVRYPQWPATETTSKEAFVSARATAFKKWPGPSARQSFMGKSCRARPYLCKGLSDGWDGNVLGRLGGWCEESERQCRRQSLRITRSSPPHCYRHPNDQKFIRFQIPKIHLNSKRRFSLPCQFLQQ